MNPMYAQMGVSVVQGVAGFVQDRIATKLARSMQKYQQQMRDISAAMNRDTITMNEIATEDASRRLQFDLALRSAKDKGAAAVSAAAAGVSGRNVDSQMRGLRGSALRAQAARKERTAQEMRQHWQERKNNNVSNIMGRDITVHARPSVLAHMGGIGATLFDIHQSNQPPGDRLGADQRDRFGGGKIDPTSDGFVDWWQ
jgi:hypothetical protein